MPRGPEGQTGRVVSSFGYFSLDKQRKVTRHQGETKCLITRDNKHENNIPKKYSSAKPFALN
jgi:hypothetical protein